MWRPLVVAAAAVAVHAVPQYHSCLEGGNGTHLPYCNTALSVDERVNDLVSRLTLSEKIGLIQISGCTNSMPADGGATRIGLEPYNWGTEMLHGAQAKCAGDRCPTIFPVLATTGATFNRSAWHAVGSAVGDEMRAINNNGTIGRTDCSLSGPGVSGWGPNINLVRDPRWGRNIEVATEDPYIAGQLAIAWVKGVQGDDPKYVKIAASLKHFSAYSMENSDGANRFGFDPTISARDVAESYLPMFKAGIVDGGALGMMCSYTSLNGTAFCESERWLARWARGKHGFRGNVVTDCGALTMPGPEGKMDGPHNAAKGLLAGADLNCGQPWAYTQQNVTAAIDSGLVPMSVLDAAVGRSLKVRMLAGVFDPLEAQPYTTIGLEALGSDAHRQLALDVAAQGLILLQNPARRAEAPITSANNSGEVGPASGGAGVLSRSGGAAAVPTLPFETGVATAVIGPHAVSREGLLGTYFDLACPPNATAAVQFGCVQSPLEAIMDLNGGDATVHAPGCANIACDALDTVKMIDDAAAAAAKADQVILLVGIDQKVEGEGHDRLDTRLPGFQSALVTKVLSVGKPTVVVLFNGGIVSLDALPTAPVAVVEAFYPGVKGAQAVAEALYGKTNRWGKLPVTIYNSHYAREVKMLDMSFFSQPGRTYKFWSGQAPLWEFGTGLSYTQFSTTVSATGPARGSDSDSNSGTDTRANVVLRSPTDKVTLVVNVTNTGDRAGDEVVLVYHTVADVAAPGVSPKPAKQVLGFDRISLEPQASGTLSFSVAASELTLVNADGDTVLFPGTHGLTVSTGDGAADIATQVVVDISAAIVLDSLPPVNPP